MEKRARVKEVRKAKAVVENKKLKKGDLKRRSLEKRKHIIVQIVVKVGRSEEK